MLTHADTLQAISVDEALLDVTNAVANLREQTLAQEPSAITRDFAKDLAELIRDQMRIVTSCEGAYPSFCFEDWSETFIHDSVNRNCKQSHACTNRHTTGQTSWFISPPRRGRRNLFEQDANRHDLGCRIPSQKEGSRDPWCAYNRRSSNQIAGYSVQHVRKCER